MLPKTGNLPARRSIRLPDFDYSQRGFYFVTICTFRKLCTFGKIQDDVVHLTPSGEIARSCWLDIPNHFPTVTLETFVVMPNHLHGILAIQERARHAVPLPIARNVDSFRNPVQGSIPTIVRSYKSAVTKLVRQATQNGALQVWQRNYFERLLRGGDELAKATSYSGERPHLAPRQKPVGARHAVPVDPRAAEPNKRAPPNRSRSYRFCCWPLVTMLRSTKSLRISRRRPSANCHDQISPPHPANRRQARPAR